MELRNYQHLPTYWQAKGLTQEQGLEELKQRVELWRTRSLAALARAEFYYLESNYGRLLRLKVGGTEVQTTGGATVPLEDAHKLYNIVRSVREGHLNHGAFTHRHIHIGHYRLDSVDHLGNCHVGCHYFTYQEALGFAERHQLPFRVASLPEKELAH